MSAATQARREAPVRFQRSRKAGWDMQATSQAINRLPAKSVTRPGKFGNDYVIIPISKAMAVVANEKTKYLSVAMSRLEAQRHAVEMFEFIQLSGMDVSELRGYNLCCFCSDKEPCHADVLLRKANSG